MRTETLLRIASRNAAIGLACCVPALLAGCGSGDGGGSEPPLLGNIRVTVEFTGSNFDTSTPVILLDGGSPQSGIGSPIVFERVATGAHQITLQGLHARCVRSGNAVQTATAATGATTDISYSVDCRDVDQLAYVSDGLVISDADGQRAHVVFDPSESFGAPAWSNDGRRLAVTYDGGIWVLNADGTDLRKLPWSDPVYKPGRLSWSPDGTRIVFTQSYTASPMVHPAKIGVIDLMGNLLGESGVVNGWVAPASWDPDSSRFAYAAVDGNPDNVTGVHVMTRDGAVASFHRDAVSGGGGAAWSPNGQTILFASGDEVREITPAAAIVRELSVCPNRCADVGWSPDGNTIIVHNSSDVRLIDTSGALLSVIPGAINTPVWSPSGIFLAWTVGGDLTIAHPDGSNARVVTGDEQIYGPTWRP